MTSPLPGVLLLIAGKVVAGVVVEGSTTGGVHVGTTPTRKVKVTLHTCVLRKVAKTIMFTVVC